ncbi:ribosomal protein L10-domain-containing protein [Globomyces pollinis-pini]|nr:ribosomal protein L10-domain-containing protein [Globomyces pollinis-pini]KAJ2994305.1 mRNA turnover 4 [Globomyces sp. JEL0801]
MGKSASRRNKIVNLTQTDKKGRPAKESLLAQVRQCVDNYSHVYVFLVHNMRNSFMKDVRTHWNDSRFFFGSNRVMAKALGTSIEDEYAENLHQISEKLSGNVGIFFTNADYEQVNTYFTEYSEKDFARGGGIATHEVVLKQGPLMRHGMNMPNNMEPMLRKLGLPTELKTGVLCLRQDYTVCKEKQTLTPEQANILKQFGIQMADFKIVLLSQWTKGGVFKSFE